MIARGMMASLVLVVGLLCGCARSGPSAAVEDPANSANAVATTALVGVWGPDSSGATGLEELGFTPDGSVAVSLVTTDAAGGATYRRTSTGSWQAIGSGAVLMSGASQGFVNGKPMSGPTARYTFRRSGDRLSLYWVEGTRQSILSRGTIHFDSLESESWVTGATGTASFTLKR
jgi:hypothetical protein